MVTVHGTSFNLNNPTKPPAPSVRFSHHRMSRGNCQANLVHPSGMIEGCRSQVTATITSEQSPDLGESLIHVPG